MWKRLPVLQLPDAVRPCTRYVFFSENQHQVASGSDIFPHPTDGQAPSFLLICTKSGVPIYCVGIVSLISCITFLVSSNNTVEVFYWFVDLTTTALIATYTGMTWTFIGWYHAKKAQPGVVPDSALTYIAPLTPYTAYFATGLGVLAMIFNGFDVFVPFDYREYINARPYF